MIPANDVLGVTGLPDFDDLKVYLLTLVLTPFGVAGATLVALYVLWRKVASYVEAARSALRTGRTVHGWLMRQLQRPGWEQGYAILTTAVMLGIQAAWLGSTFVVGNLISVAFGPRSSAEGLEVKTASGLLGVLHWDTITQIYVLICVVSIVASYKLVKETGAPRFLFFICGLPGWFWGVFGALGAAVATVAHLVGLHVDGLDTSGQLISIWEIVAAGLVFLALTHAALTAPAIIRRSWRNSGVHQSRV